MENETDTITLEEKPEAVVPTVPETPTPEQLKAKGWTPEEIDSAQKKGLLPSPEAKPEEKPSPKPEALLKPEEKPKPSINGSLPDFTMTPDQEKVFFETFGPGTPARAMYFRMKNERKSRQNSDSKVVALEAELKALKEMIKAPAPKPEIGTDGEPIDPETRPLTLKDLRELQKQEQAEIDKQAEENQTRAPLVKEAQLEQEAYARTVYPDFDDTVTRAKEVMLDMDNLVPEKLKQTRIVKLIRELQIAAANADKLGIEDDHAAMLAYEIGKFHPEFGKTLEKSEQTGSLDPKPNGRVSPEKMKRIETNTQRRPSSASIKEGGGKRTLAVSEVDLATLNGMSLKDRMSFKKNHPDRYAKILRG